MLIINLFDFCLVRQKVIGIKMTDFKLKKETPSQYRKRLQSLFYSSGLLPIDPPEEKERINAALKCNIPHIDLFQYRSCTKHNIYNFWKNQQVLVNPVKFNDPFDSFPACDNEKIENSFSSLTETKFRELIDIVRLRPLDEKEIKELGGMQTVSILQKISEIPQEELEKCFYPNFEKIKQNGLNQTIDFINALVKMLQQSIRIACFSEVCDSPIMWGHYADSGKGFCIKYRVNPFHHVLFCKSNRIFTDSSCANQGLLSILPVIYQNERYNCTRIIEEQQKYFVADTLKLDLDLSYFDFLRGFKISCFKSADWKYEKEWRLILDRATGLPDYYAASIFKAEALYLGPHIAWEDEIMLLNYAAIMKTANEKPLPIYKMVVDWAQRKFQLKAVPYSHRNVNGN